MTGKKRTLWDQLHKDNYADTKKLMSTTQNVSLRERLDVSGYIQNQGPCSDHRGHQRHLQCLGETEPGLKIFLWHPWPFVARLWPWRQNHPEYVTVCSPLTLNSVNSKVTYHRGVTYQPICHYMIEKGDSYSKHRPWPLSLGYISKKFSLLGQKTVKVK